MLCAGADKRPAASNVAVMTVIADTYTGHVEPGSGARRSLPGATIVKVSVGPMDNNAYLITCAATGETLLIDAANDADTLLEVIREHVPKVSLIVTSHQHFDHWQALEAVAAATGAPTAAHELDTEPLPVKPDRILSHGDTLTVGNLEFAVIHLRGHTPGSVALALTGDAVGACRSCSAGTACSRAASARPGSPGTSSGSSTTSPPGCSTSTPTRRWSIPATETTPRSAPNARHWANGASVVGSSRALR